MKAVMSFTQLVGLGYSREALKKYSREADFPGYKSPGGGKWFVYVDDLAEWISQYNERRENISEAVKHFRKRQKHGRRKRA